MILLTEAFLKQGELRLHMNGGYGGGDDFPGDSMAISLKSRAGGEKKQAHLPTASGRPAPCSTPFARRAAGRLATHSGMRRAAGAGQYQYQEQEPNPGKPFAHKTARHLFLLLVRGKVYLL